MSFITLEKVNNNNEEVKETHIETSIKEENKETTNNTSSKKDTKLNLLAIIGFILSIILIFCKANIASILILIISLICNILSLKSKSLISIIAIIGLLIDIVIAIIYFLGFTFNNTVNNHVESNIIKTSTCSLIDESGEYYYKTDDSTISCHNYVCNFKSAQKSFTFDCKE